MAFKNPLMGSGGSVTLDSDAIPHVTDIALDKTGTDPEYSSSDTDGEVYTVAGCDKNVLTVTALINNDATDLAGDRGTIYTVVAKVSSGFTAISADMLLSEIRVGSPIRECTFTTVTYVFKTAKKEAAY
jgi:hypothetical protein